MTFRKLLQFAARDMKFGAKVPTTSDLENIRQLEDFIYNFRIRLSEII
jgi:hypothetical protein